MATVSDLVSEIKTALGRTDTTLNTVCIRGINAGLVVAAALFKPRSLATTGNVTITAGNSSASISSLSPILTIEEVLNTSNSTRMWMLTLSELRSFALPTGNHPLFYALHGNSIFVAPAPTSDATVTLYYTTLPTRVSALEDTLPLGEYQDFVLSVATAFVWGALEELESSALWTKISETIGVPLKDFAEAKTIFERQVDEHDLPTTVSRRVAAAERS